MRGSRIGNWGMGKSTIADRHFAVHTPPIGCTAAAVESVWPASINERCPSVCTMLAGSHLSVDETETSRSGVVIGCALGEVRQRDSVDNEPMERDTDRQTDRQTHRPRYSVCSDRQHLAMRVMRPNYYYFTLSL